MSTDSALEPTPDCKSGTEAMFYSIRGNILLQTIAKVRTMAGLDTVTLLSSDLYPGQEGPFFCGTPQVTNYNADMLSGLRT